VLRIDWLTHNVGTILDTAYRQCGYESAVDDPQSYLNEKTAGTEDGVAQYAFGRCYRDHCGRCLAFAKTGEPKDDFYLLFFQAAIMMINNAVCRDLEQIGGLEALLNMEDADFKVAQDQIMTSLHRNLVD
jgi:hypothetical protein